MERPEARPFKTRCSEQLQRLRSWSGGEGEEAQVLMFAVIYYFPHDGVICINFIFRLSFDLSIFPKGVGSVGKSRLELDGRLSCLG